jgi:hypothetical protein
MSPQEREDVFGGDVFAPGGMYDTDLVTLAARRIRLGHPVRLVPPLQAQRPLVRSQACALSRRVPQLPAEARLQPHRWPMSAIVTFLAGMWAGAMLATLILALLT